VKHALGVCVLVAAACAGGTAQALPSFDAVRAAWRSSDAVMLDRHGAPLAALRIDHEVRRLEWVRLEDVSQALRLALLYSEDRRFYAHSGVDWSAVAAAAWGNLWHTRTRGASTITMQLAGLLDEAARRPRGGARGLPQKLQQVVGAAQLEAHWRKDEILEAYLNLLPFRGELVGVAAMSAALFDKHPGGLDAVEAVLDVLRERLSVFMNIDFALAALVLGFAALVWRGRRRETQRPLDREYASALRMLKKRGLVRGASTPARPFARQASAALPAAAGTLFTAITESYLASRFGGRPHVDSPERLAALRRALGRSQSAP